MWDCSQQMDHDCLANISRLDILLCREDLSRRRSLWKDLVELNIMVLDRKAE